MSSDAAPIKAPHTSVFLILLMPFGVSSGYVGVTLAFLLSAHGMKAAAIGGILALSILPQTWKVLWAPVVDTTLNAKTWYVLGALGVGLTIIAMSVIRTPMAALPLLSALVIVSSIASSFTSMASETFMANLDPQLQGRASGWSQAGNFAGAGLGGGLGLVLAQHVQAQWVSGAALGLLCIACAAPLLLLTEADRTHMRGTLRETLGEVLRDVWSVVRTRAGLLVIVLMLLPLGAGGASGIMTATARQWRVSGDLVGLVGGVGGGIVAIVGALIGGYVCDLMDRRTAYCLMGCLVAPVLIATALAPRTPLVWVTAFLAYGAVIAACYAAYSAVVLEVIGRGAAATKYNFMSSVANVPVTVMPLVDGFLHDRAGANAMFFGESTLSVVAALFFGLLVLSTRRWRPVPAPAT
jgi:MFS family permease